MWQVVDAKKILGSADVPAIRAGQFIRAAKVVFNTIKRVFEGSGFVLGKKIFNYDIAMDVDVQTLGRCQGWKGYRFFAHTSVGVNQ